MSIIIPSDNVNRKISQWKAITSFLNEWYYKPDTTILRMVLSQYAAHTCLSEDPVWSFIVGPPSMGKSTVIIKPLSWLPNTHFLDVLSPNSFLSGFGQGTGLLQRLPAGSGVIVMDDFSTFLKMRPDYKSELQTQLRRMFGGELSKVAGNKQKTIEWKGKVTFIAACTEALYQYWSVGHDLGERFLYGVVECDTSAKGQRQMNIFKRKHAGMGTKIAEDYRELILEFCDPDNFDGNVNFDYTKHDVSDLAILVSSIRQSVHRDSYNRNIVAIDKPEGPGRTIGQLNQLARGQAILFNRTEVNDQDIKLAYRAVADTIKCPRFAVIETIILYGEMFGSKYSLDSIRLEKFAGLTETSLRRAKEDLLAIGLLEYNGRANRTKYLINPDYIPLIEDSNLRSYLLRRAQAQGKIKPTLIRNWQSAT